MESGKISTEDNQSWIYSSWFYYTNSPKRHCASRLDYKPAEWDTITLDHVISTTKVAKSQACSFLKIFHML